MDSKDFWKRQKQKQAKQRKAVKLERLTRTPILKRDPAPLLVEIERLRRLEAQEKLDGPNRMRRKHLEEQFEALRKAREKAGMPVMVLQPFLPEDYKELENNESAGSWPPLPDDEPYNIGPPGLPPYQLKALDETVEEQALLLPKTESLIKGEAVINTALLDEELDAFMKCI